VHTRFILTASRQQDTNNHNDWNNTVSAAIEEDGPTQCERSYQQLTNDNVSLMVT
jgi:hypothetical protein